MGKNYKITKILKDVCFGKRLFCLKHKQLKFSNCKAAFVATSFAVKLCIKLQMRLVHVTGKPFFVIKFCLAQNAVNTDLSGESAF